MATIPAKIRRRMWKKIGFNFATMPRLPCFIDPEGNEGSSSFQTFSLDHEVQWPITLLLLDRFLACMKPASIT
ncbi:MAG: hypothetical protein AAGL92_11655, partial [Pseudomonadota bacterium]